MPNRRDFTRTLAAAALAGLARPAAAQSGLTKLQVGTNAADDVTITQQPAGILSGVTEVTT